MYRLCGGQDYYFEHFALDQGLSQGSGYATVRFDDYIWFATNHPGSICSNYFYLDIRITSISTMFNISFSRLFNLTCIMLFAGLFLFACKAKKEVSLKSVPCRFSAGLNELSSQDELIIKNQIAVFNQHYSLFSKQMPSGDAAQNPYAATDYILTHDPLNEPNATFEKLGLSSDSCGLFIGFGKPYSDRNSITLYLMLVKQKLSVTDGGMCKIDYAYISNANGPVCFSYNTAMQGWTGLDKSIIDKWTANLYSANTASAPKFKGYYIHHTFGEKPLPVENMYIGLASGNTGDTLNLFSMDKPFEIINTGGTNDIKFHSSHLRGTTGISGISTTFTLADSAIEKSSMVRPCPPHCPQ
ncbi:MAG TPA: hypothetical protein VFG10_10325 [Saprospiraceae bacterium]|nr:hypothetical protein [Saprospiraceae bacterium]